MGRAKISMELIPREKSRNATFVKRRKGLKKKINEFSILCGVDACMIVFSGSTATGSDSNNNDNHPICDQLTQPVEVWPENRNEVHHIINRFRSSTKQERSKRSVNLSDMFEDRKKKTEEEVLKLRQKNNADLSDRINKLKEEELRELLGSLDCKIQMVNEKIGLLKCKNETGMIEYSLRAPDHQNNLAAPLLTQPIHYMSPSDHHHHHLYHHQILSHNCPSDQSMSFDVGPSVTMPIINHNFKNCDDPDYELAANFNTWPTPNSQIIYDFDCKPLDCIQFCNSVPSPSMQQIQPWSSYPPYTSQGAWDQQMSLNPSAYDFQDPVQGFSF